MPDDYYVSQYSGEEWDAMLAGVAGSVRYDLAQSLTDTQQAQARGNIAAASTNELNAIPKPNLFINPLFQVWQLYPSGWSGVPVNRYVCDGWSVLSSDGSKSNDFTPAYPCGMVNGAGGANCTVAQFLVDASRYNGLQMTCSVLKIRDDGSQSFVSATKTASGWTDTTDILAFFGTSNQWRWINEGETFVGAKLEVGAKQTFVYKQADGTYTLNNIPPVAEQLAICNKYDPKTGKLLGGWDHPPMELGVEYRTTERYLGKPMYTMAFSFGALPNASDKVVAMPGTDSTCKIIEIHGYASNEMTLPGVSGTSTGSQVTLTGVGNRAYVITGSDRSSATATIVAKYIKTTD